MALIMYKGIMLLTDGVLLLLQSKAASSSSNQNGPFGNVKVRSLEIAKNLESYESMTKGFHCLTRKFLQNYASPHSPQIPNSLYRFCSSISTHIRPSIVAENPSRNMEPEKGKQSSHKTPYTELEQVNSDFIQAIAMQEQEGTFTMLATMDSEESSNEDESEFSSEDDEDGDADFSESQEFELGDLQFLEGEGSNYEEMEEEEEEDEIDPDEMSYEELIELAEFIGEERRGLSANEIPSSLRPYTCHFAENKTGIDRCVICQVEYEEGEALMALHCDHPYHSDCITKWLQVKKVCPICSSDVSAPKLPNNPS